MDMQKAWSICGEIVAREAFRSQLDAYARRRDNWMSELECALQFG